MNSLRGEEHNLIMLIKFQIIYKNARQNHKSKNRKIL